MNKLFEYDVEALEEVTIRVRRTGFLEVWSANNEFALSVYGVTHTGGKVLLETIPSDSINGVSIELIRFSDGNIYAKHIMHGNEDYSPAFVDAHYTANDVDYFIITANEAVTVRYYD